MVGIRNKNFNKKKKMKTNNKETLILICACHSFEHQIIFSVLEEDTPEMSVNTHLITHKNVFKRIWVAIRYVFGYKSRYGEWDEFIFKLENIEDLKTYLINKKKKTPIDLTKFRSPAVYTKEFD